MKTYRNFDSGHFRGFTLIEVMVALAIGMITALVVMQATTASDAQRRRTSAGSSADSAGAIALQTVQRTLYGAGAGMTGDSGAIFTNCFGVTVNAANSQRSTVAFSFPANSFAPLAIWNSAAPPAHLNAAGFDANTDIIQVISGGSDYFFGRGIPVGSWANPTDFSHIVAADGWDETWDAIPGLHSGDLAIVVQSGQSCRISQITSLSNQGRNVSGETACDAPVANSATTGARIGHSTGTFRNFYNGCRSETSNWNGGTPFGGATGVLYSLGPPDRFSVLAYGIRNGQLAACAPLYQDCALAASWQVVGDGIVSLKAQYGIDADNDQIVAAGEWTRTAPTGAVTWDRLKSVRIALVARNKQMERDVVDTTDCAPLWSGYTTADATCAGAIDPSQIFLASGNDGANWNRYRYRVFETTVPLRNLYWSN